MNGPTCDDCGEHVNHCTCPPGIPWRHGPPPREGWYWLEGIEGDDECRVYEVELTPVYWGEPRHLCALYPAQGGDMHWQDVSGCRRHAPIGQPYDD